MNPNIPRGAAILLDFIADLETKRQGQAAYETIIGYRNEKPGTLPTRSNSDSSASIVIRSSGRVSASSYYVAGECSSWRAGS
ncbi:MAG TPA: hypothetical protein VGV07_22300 [Devosia sp.]|jgi:hypothetical protein|uniref:hypothetical protein n=1 Tax=Devosia sp. TaxID=1871048 RepID=UPI002DDD5796|nr:hypothetical protein [Devosia sp.]HEV2518000.1 hypothetical protein [Devosia sp.]